jgi:hypothetical protein
LGIIKTRKDHWLLGFLLMNPFFSTIFTCLIIQSLCFRSYFRALACLGTASHFRWTLKGVTFVGPSPVT